MGATGAVALERGRRSPGGVLVRDSNHGAGGVHGACTALTAAGHPCRRPTGTPAASATLCGLHELARRRRAHAVREAVLIAIGPDNVARWQ